MAEHCRSLYPGGGSRWQGIETLSAQVKPIEALPQVEPAGGGQRAGVAVGGPGAVGGHPALPRPTATGHHRSRVSLPAGRHNRSQKLICHNLF